MKNAVWIMMKKELARFFGDKRMAFSTILLPGLMIFLLYSVMGNALTSQLDPEKQPEETFIAVVSELPDSLAEPFAQAGITVTVDDPAAGQEQVRAQEAQLCLVFSAHFDSRVAAYAAASGEAAPEVAVYYNSDSDASSTAHQLVSQLLDQYEAAISNKFDVNPDEDTLYDLSASGREKDSFLASMLPMLLLVFLYSGCLAVAPESIAGEKERGTIAALLITPAKRSHLALGKILALAVIALLSGISSAAGTILSLPKLMGGDASLTNVSYAPSDYLMLGVVILSTVLLLITVISLISAFAHTVKEAQTYVMPLMILVLLTGVTAMFGSNAKDGLTYYLIPIYNSVQCMVGIFSFHITATQILVAAASNLVYTGLGVFLLTKMFGSERVMFSR